MIENYYKVAARTLARNPGYTVINVVGLALGLACCMILAVYVVSEWNYDRYHPDADRIFRVAEHRTVPLGEIWTPQISPAVAPAIKSGFPVVEQAARIDPVHNGMVSNGSLTCFEDRIVAADPELLDILHIPFARGNPETALDDRLSVLITEQMATKYFADADPLGQTIMIKDPFLVERHGEEPKLVEYTVTGVIEDPPSNTHFKYGFISSLAGLAGNERYEIWDGGGAYTYLKLAAGVDAAEFEKRISHIAYTYYGETLRSWGQEREYLLQPLLDIHFKSKLEGFAGWGGGGEMEPPGNSVYVYIYSVIGLLVLLIGCMNYINLSNAQSVRRSREVGLRKVVGASRMQLIRQFLGESLLVTLLAAFLGLVLAEGLLPLFNDFAGTRLQLTELANPAVLLAVIGLLLLVGLVAGGYPAFVLTAFKPVTIMKGSAVAGRRGSSMLRLLVVGQFAISLFLAISTVTVYQQLDFLRNRNLGFDKEQKLVLPFRMNTTIRDGSGALKSELMAHHSITSATASSSVPGRFIRKGALSFRAGIHDAPLALKFISCDANFIGDYGIEMIAGRTFDESQNDERGAFIINERAVKHLGYASPEEAMGQRLWESWYGRDKVIVGVTSNFHYEGTQREVEPLFMEHSSSRFDALTLTVATTGLDETLEFVESRWLAVFPGLPYEAFFLDEDFEKQFRSERQVGRLLGLVAGMGLVIACLGLLGLAAFITRQRAGEIGIRKVLGASEASIIVLFSRDFVLLVIAASLIACPAATYAMTLWLSDFTYRVEMNWMTYVLPSVLGLLLALMTVSTQAFKAAHANPVEALKCE